MTDKTKLKENIVKPLKSVVVTKKEGYQVSKLGYGYSQLVGTSILYKGLKIIKVKPDKDLTHIERLIQNQMGGKAKSYRSRQSPGINRRNGTHSIMQLQKTENEHWSKVVGDLVKSQLKN